MPVAARLVGVEGVCWLEAGGCCVNTGEGAIGPPGSLVDGAVATPPDETGGDGVVPPPDETGGDGVLPPPDATGGDPVVPPPPDATGEPDSVEAAAGFAIRI